MAYPPGGYRPPDPPPWKLDLIDSVLKLRLYGPRFRINQSYPGNIGSYDLIFQSYPGNSGSYDPYISPILEILDRTIHIYQSYVDVAGGRGGSPGVAGGRGVAGEAEPSGGPGGGAPRRRAGGSGGRDLTLILSFYLSP